MEMIWSKKVAIFVHGLLIILATRLDLITADYLIRTKTHYLHVSTLLTPAFAVKRGKGQENSDYVGIIPELLAELKKRNGLLQTYYIYPPTKNEIGQRQSDGNWTGVIQDVLSGVADIGAGPILDTPEHSQTVLLSKPWASVGMTLVLKNSSNVTSLKKALDKWFQFYVVADSPEANELRKVNSQQGSSDVATLQQRITTVGSVREGLLSVSREENSALVLNTEEARFYVTHDFCDLAMVPTFHPLGNYTFAFPRGSLNLDAFNRVLLEMKADGSLEKLKEKTLGQPGECSDAMFLHPGTGVTFLLAAAITSVSGLSSAYY